MRSSFYEHLSNRSLIIEPPNYCPPSRLSRAADAMATKDALLAGGHADYTDDAAGAFDDAPRAGGAEAQPLGPPGLLVCGLPAADAAWLAVFCGTGVGLGMAFEFLDLHSVDHTPAADQTFFLCFLGYWAQTLVGAAFAFWPRPGHHSSPWRGAWTPPVLSALAASAALDGAAQALDYVGQVQGGYLLFTVFHASVTVFSCGLAVLLLRAKITGPQWAGVALIVAGVLVTTLPSPIEVTGNFYVGLGASLLGSLCLAASYPLSELVFARGAAEPAGRLTEEMACVAGSLLNTGAFTLWTLVYTVPRWHAAVSAFTLPGHGAAKACGFGVYALTVGLHSLAFWKSIYRLGTVPTAVAKGAQQAGVFACSHLFFCHLDESECIDYNYGNSLWNRLQKSVAFALCCFGVAVYSLNKRGHLPSPPPQQNLSPLISYDP